VCLGGERKREDFLLSKKEGEMKKVKDELGKNREKVKRE
jgi:hypothetical protein